MLTAGGVVTAAGVAIFLRKIRSSLGLGRAMQSVRTLRPPGTCGVDTFRIPKHLDSNLNSIMMCYANDRHTRP